jgi:hypothetical protein
MTRAHRRAAGGAHGPAWAPIAAAPAPSASVLARLARRAAGAAGAPLAIVARRAATAAVRIPRR